VRPVEAFPRERRFYEAEDGSVPARDWLDSREGTDEYGAIMVGLEKVMQGNFGDHRALGGGVSELRIKFGVGYRVYYGLVGQELVILLVVGAKPTQDQDIKTAQQYWEKFRA
jgi:putative addiction module killer protein